MIPVYPAGEKPIAGATGERLAEAIAVHGHHSVHYVDGFSAVADLLAPQLCDGDVLIALGAGDVNKVLRVIHDKLNSRTIGQEGGS